MQFETLEITNFRSIKTMKIPLSSLVTIVGQNNSGKSSLMIALNLFVSGGKISRKDFYDPSRDIELKVAICGITDEILSALLAPEHSIRIKEIVNDGKLVLVRRYKASLGDALQDSSLRYIGSIPSDLRLRPEAIASLMKGKKGEELKSAILSTFPELENFVSDTKTQSGFTELIHEKLTRRLPTTSFILEELPLPSGMNQSIEPLLPEVIYVPAVKDVNDELKKGETTSFGRIIKFGS